MLRISQVEPQVFRRYIDRAGDVGVLLIAVRSSFAWKSSRSSGTHGLSPRDCAIPIKALLFCSPSISVEV